MKEFVISQVSRNKIEELRLLREDKEHAEKLWQEYYQEKLDARKYLICGISLAASSTLTWYLLDLLVYLHSHFSFFPVMDTPLPENFLDIIMPLLVYSIILFISYFCLVCYRKILASQLRPKFNKEYPEAGKLLDLKIE